jgi:hypothetical protein
MVKQSPRLKSFEADFKRKDKPDLQRNLRLQEELYREAKALAVFPLKDPLFGIDIDIKIAKTINSVPKTS